MSAGGDDVRRQLAEYIRDQARPIDKFSHQPRLYRLTRLVGEGQSYDDEVVYAAAWLHDLGVFVGHRPAELVALQAWDNVRYAMKQAPAILLRIGFSEAKIAAVVEAIRTHQPSASPETMEGVVLRDADILEQLGSIGILRAAAKTGRDTRYLTFSSVAQTLRKNLEQLPQQLRLEKAKAIARSRVALLQYFLAELDSEVEGDLF